MAIRQRITDDERDELTKDVDDLDKAYIERMKEAGISENLLAQFRDLSLEIRPREDQE